MLVIDGSTLSGSGTIVRLAVSLAGLYGQSLRLYNIRARRKKPGLRAQHVAALNACRDLCGGELGGAAVGSREITFSPAHPPRGGTFVWDIGTAGSAVLLLLTVLPLALFASGPTVLRVTGGVFQDFAPSPYHTAHVLLPLLRRMGARAELTVLRPGYVPGGKGTVELRVWPVADLAPLVLVEQGQLQRITGVALASHLEERRVASRMAQSLARCLRGAGVPVCVAENEDKTAAHPGAALAAWAETDKGALLGADRAGSPGRSSEAIGRYVAALLREDLASGATTDRFAADQLVVYAALASGTTKYRVPRLTEHLETNIWLVRQILNLEASFATGEKIVCITGRAPV
ncbi:MAG: RNA 3'-terminal phosphate cyclase [Bacillota bacterium]